MTEQHHNSGLLTLSNLYTRPPLGLLRASTPSLTGLLASKAEKPRAAELGLAVVCCECRLRCALWVLHGVPLTQARGGAVLPRPLLCSGAGARG